MIHRQRIALCAAVVLLTGCGKSCGPSTLLRGTSDPAHGPVDRAPIASSTPVTRANTMPWSLVAGHDSLYWGQDEVPTFGYAGGVYRVAKSGGDAVQVSSGTNVHVVASSSALLFWYDADVVAAGTIWSMPLDGGPKTAVATSTSMVKGIVADEAYVYWTAAGGRGEKGLVARARNTGGPPQVLARDAVNVGGIAADERAVYWIDRGPAEAFGLGSETFEDGRIMSCAKNGEHCRALATRIHAPLMAIAIDANDVFVTTGEQMAAASGRVYRVHKSGGALVAIGPHLKNLEALAVDDASVYWSSEGELDGGIWRMAKTGGTLTHLAKDQARSMSSEQGKLFFSSGGAVGMVLTGGGP